MCVCVFIRHTTICANSHSYTENFCFVIRTRERGAAEWQASNWSTADFDRLGAMWGES